MAQENWRFVEENITTIGQAHCWSYSTTDAVYGIYKNWGLGDNFRADYTFGTSPEGKHAGPTSGEKTYSISDRGIQIHDEGCDKASNIQFTDKLISIQCNYLLQAGMKEPVVIHKINRYSGKYEQIRSYVGAEGALIHSGTCRRAQKKF